MKVGPKSFILPQSQGFLKSTFQKQDMGPQNFK